MQNTSGMFDCVLEPSKSGMSHSICKESEFDACNDQISENQCEIKRESCDVEDSSTPSIRRRNSLREILVDDYGNLPDLVRKNNQL